MNLTIAILEDIIKVEHCYQDNAEYRINTPIALTLRQLILLEEKFGMKYANIKKADNWGTVSKFDVVINYLELKITPMNESEFKRLLESLKQAVYPTENNFTYYIENDWA